MYHRLFHRRSGPVQAAPKNPHSVSRLSRAAFGCKGLASLRSSTPCPWAFPWRYARFLACHGRCAKPQGQGLRPCTLARCARPLPLFFYAWPSRRLPAFQGSVSSRCSGASPRRRFYSCSQFLYGYENDIQGRIEGCVRFPETVPASKAVPTKCRVRCHGDRVGTRDGDWILAFLAGTSFG